MEWARENHPEILIEGNSEELLNYFDKHPDSDYNLVNIADLRDMSGWDVEKLHNAIKDLRKKGLITLTSAEGRHGITPREREVLMEPEDPSEGKLLFIGRRN